MAALSLKTDATGEALYASRSYQIGETVVDFGDAVVRAERDKYTVERPGGGHLFHPVLAKTSHGCEPNCRISFPDQAMIAVRPIAAGEAITFDYMTTESAITHPFDCLCGCSNCRGRVG